MGTQVGALCWVWVLLSKPYVTARLSLWVTGRRLRRACFLPCKQSTAAPLLVLTTRAQAHRLCD